MLYVAHFLEQLFPAQHDHDLLAHELDLETVEIDGDIVTIIF